MRLENKTALITGAASGIGRATALLFAREGAAVAIADLNQNSGNDAVREIQAAGGRAIFETTDVTRASGCKRIVQRTLTEFGRIDILFNNAGIICRFSGPDTNEEDWNRVIDVNLKSI